MRACGTEWRRYVPGVCVCTSVDDTQKSRSSVYVQEYLQRCAGVTQPLRLQSILTFINKVPRTPHQQYFDPLLSYPSHKSAVTVPPRLCLSSHPPPQWFDVEEINGDTPRTKWEKSVGPQVSSGVGVHLWGMRVRASGVDVLALWCRVWVLYFLCP